MRRFAEQLTRIADGTPEQLRSEAPLLLETALGADRLLEPAECEPDPDRYRQHILHVDPAGRFSIVALVWLPGQATAIHDHVAWCITGIHTGEESEQQYEIVRAYPTVELRAGEVALNRPGTVSELPPLGRDIHRVRCVGDDTAISLHIYGTDIARRGSSINVVYDESSVTGGPSAGLTYCAVNPPSAAMIAPVTNEDSSLARNSAT
jgi:predicted metal-dependent enzyme (double-stranded beta helix superfamily)